MEREAHVLAHRSDRHAIGLRDRQALDIQGFDQARHRLRQAAVVVPGLALFHSREVAQGVGQMGLRVHVTEMDRNEVRPLMEPVATRARPRLMSSRAS